VISGFHRVNEIFPLLESYAASLVVTDVSGQLIVPNFNDLKIFKSLKLGTVGSPKTSVA